MKRPPSKYPKPPKHLSREAKTWWGTVCEGWELDEPSLLILASALEAFDRMRAAQAVIAKEGITCHDRHGQARAHPATTIERDSRAAMARMLKNLGLDLEPLHDRPGRPAGT